MEDRSLACYIQSMGSQRVGHHLVTEQCVHAKLLHSCSTLPSPMDYNPPGSSIHGIFQARILEWVAMPSSRGSSWPSSIFLIEPMSPSLAGRFIITGTNGHVILLKVVPCSLPSCFILPSDFSPMFLRKTEGWCSSFCGFKAEEGYWRYLSGSKNLWMPGIGPQGQDGSLFPVGLGWNPHIAVSLMWSCCTASTTFLRLFLMMTHFLLYQTTKITICKWQKTCWLKKRCTRWELRVKFCLGQNEDCSLEGNTSDNSEKAPQRKWSKVDI